MASRTKNRSFPFWQWAFLLAAVGTFFALFALGMISQQQRDATVARFEASEKLEALRARLAARQEAVEQSDGLDVTSGEAGAGPQLTHRSDAHGIIDAVDALAEEDREWIHSYVGGNGPLTDEEWAKLGTFLTEHAEVISGVRNLVERGEPWYEMAMTVLGLEIKTSLLSVREMCNLLAMQCGHDMHRGNTEAGLASFSAMFAMGDALGSEPTTIASAMAFAMRATALRTLERSIPAGTLNAGQLEQVDAMLSSSKNAYSLSDIFLIEADNTRRVFELGYGTGGPLDWFFSSPLGETILNRDETTYTDLMQRTAEAAEHPFYEAKPALDEINADIESMPWSRLYSRTIFSDPAMRFVQQAEMEAWLDLAQIGLQVEQFYVEHGGYPATLRALNADAAERVDPFSGNAYRYQVTGDAFRLYSVGRNMEDDGGRHDHLAGDFVWRGSAQAQH